jgi:SnoaL-like domain
MITHRFAVAAARGDSAAMAAVFAEDVTYHTPTLTADLHGKDLTLRYLRAGTGIVNDLEYTDQVGDDEQTILFWKGILDQREISGATVLAGEAGGLVHDITVLQRPWGVAANFRDGILPALAEVVPLPAWQLDDRKVPAPDPDAGAGRRPGGPLPLAPGVAFHGAMLTKTLSGQENVGAYHELIDGIQGARTYLARFTSAGRLVEYWSCVIDGHLQQGIDDFKLDGNGRVTDQTVWLRPWPVVTVLRDRAIAASLPFLTADYWRLPAGPTRLPLQPGSRAQGAGLMDTFAGRRPGRGTFSAASRSCGRGGGGSG